MNPQLFGSAMDRLYAAGALEVFYVPVQMKKNRPGTLLTVVAPPELRSTLADIVFRETTTIGLRHYEVEREVPAARDRSRRHAVRRGPLQARLARRARHQRRAGVRRLCGDRQGQKPLGQGRAGHRPSGVRCGSNRRQRHNREPLLHHHADLLHQRGAAPRSRVHDDGRRRGRARASADGRRRVLSDRHRRARAESRAGGPESRSRRQASSPIRRRRSSATSSRR